MMSKLIAWRLVGAEPRKEDVWTVSDFAAPDWTANGKVPWSLDAALGWLNRDAGDGYQADCRVIAWPANEVLP